MVWLIAREGLNDDVPMWLALKDSSPRDAPDGVIRLQPHTEFVSSPDEAIKFLDEESAVLTMRALFRRPRDRDFLVARAHTPG